MHTDTRTSSKLHKHLLETGYTLGYLEEKQESQNNDYI